MRYVVICIIALSLSVTGLSAQSSGQVNPLQAAVPTPQPPKKIEPSGPTCDSLAAAKKAAKKPVIKKQAPKSQPPRTGAGDPNSTNKLLVESQALKSQLIDCNTRAEALKDSLIVSRSSMEKLKDSLNVLEQRVVYLKDSLSKRVSLPRIWVDTVYISHANVKSLVAASLVSAGLGYTAGFFTHSHNELTATIIHTNQRLDPSKIELVRFTLPISR